MREIIIPELGEGIKNAAVSCWYAKVGDHVAEGDDVVELVTDKATFNVPAPISGKIKAVLANIGEEKPIGAPLAIMEKDDA